MKLFLFLLTCTSSLTLTNAATANCNGICEIPLEKPCLQVVEEMQIEGDCCALTEEEGLCTLWTTTSCYIQVKGDTGCTEEADGTTSCVIPGTQWGAINTNKSCPASEFEIPVMTDADELKGVPAAQPILVLHRDLKFQSSSNNTAMTETDEAAGTTKPVTRSLRGHL